MVVVATCLSKARGKKESLILNRFLQSTIYTVLNSKGGGGGGIRDTCLNLKMSHACVLLYFNYGIHDS